MKEGRRGGDGEGNGQGWDKCVMLAIESRRDKKQNHDALWLNSCRVL